MKRKSVGITPALLLGALLLACLLCWIQFSSGDPELHGTDFAEHEASIAHDGKQGKLEPRIQRGDSEASDLRGASGASADQATLNIASEGIRSGMEDPSRVRVVRRTGEIAEDAVVGLVVYPSGQCFGTGIVFMPLPVSPEEPGVSLLHGSDVAAAYAYAGKLADKRLVQDQCPVYLEAINLPVEVERRPLARAAMLERSISLGMCQTCTVKVLVLDETGAIADRPVRISLDVVAKAPEEGLTAESSQLSMPRRVKADGPLGYKEFIHVGIRSDLSIYVDDPSRERMREEVRLAGPRVEGEVVEAVVVPLRPAPRIVGIARIAGIGVLVNAEMHIKAVGKDRDFAFTVETESSGEWKIVILGGLVEWQAVDYLILTHSVRGGAGKGTFYAKVPLELGDQIILDVGEVELHPADRDVGQPPVVSGRVVDSGGQGVVAMVFCYSCNPLHSASDHSLASGGGKLIGQVVTDRDGAFEVNGAYEGAELALHIVAQRFATARLGGISPGTSGLSVCLEAAVEVAGRIRFAGLIRVPSDVWVRAYTGREMRGEFGVDEGGSFVVRGLHSGSFRFAVMLGGCEIADLGCIVLRNDETPEGLRDIVLDNVLESICLRIECEGGDDVARGRAVVAGGSGNCWFEEVEFGRNLETMLTIPTKWASLSVFVRGGGVATASRAMNWVVRVPSGIHVSGIVRNFEALSGLATLWVNLSSCVEERVPGCVIRELFPSMIAVGDGGEFHVDVPAPGLYAFDLFAVRGGDGVAVKLERFERSCSGPSSSIVLELREEHVSLVRN